MFIDLSVQLDDRTPAYPGDPKITITQTETFAHQGYCGHQITLGTHTGTHIDAPVHMIENGKNLDDFSLDTFIGPAKCVDVRTGFDRAAYEAAGIDKGDIVLFHTGMASKYYKEEYFTDYPVINSELAEYLVNKKVKIVGFDTCSADNTQNFPIHKLLLGSDILILENLTNLHLLPANGFSITALPLHLGLDAAPTRVIAEVDAI